MHRRIALGFSAALFCTVNASAQNAANAPAAVPAEQTAAAATNKNWRAPKFSWGHPNLEGTFTSRDMGGIPLQRPDEFGTRQFLTQEEFQARVTAGPSGFAAFVNQQSEDASRLELSALDSTETGTRVFGYTSYVIEPLDGKVPAFTEEGRQRQARVRPTNGPYHTTADFSYYDRCITRGVTGSIMPSLYGDAMRIIQSPTEVAISYEMLHDTRVVPLDGRAQASEGVRQYMGSSVGHFEGNTLVVETTNFTDELSVGRMPHSEEMKLTERFTRIDPDMLDYVVTVDDPRTYTAPWTFRLTLTTQPGYEVLEYSCHEGNNFIRTALRAEQQYQQRVAAARDKGEPIPERPRARNTGGGLGIFAPPSETEAVEIGTAQ
ncbi:MAG TPA: hypothetical protein VM692_12850 [Gammaproteobacteria bacterium]|nr:hypothetical protein [Gammaproteobacteria bacterium]